MRPHRAGGRLVRVRDMQAGPLLAPHVRSDSEGVAEQAAALQDSSLAGPAPVQLHAAAPWASRRGSPGGSRGAQRRGCAGHDTTSCRPQARA